MSARVGNVFFRLGTGGTEINPQTGICISCKIERGHERKVEAEGPSATDI